MPRRPLARVRGATLVALALGAGALEAQALVGRAEVVLRNQHQWRGIRRADAPIASGGLTLGLALGEFHALAAGASGLAELARADPRHRSDLALDERGWSEAGTWIEYSLAAPGWGAGLGVSWTRYRRPGPDPTTREAYLRLERVSALLTPRLAVWYDWADGGRGGYGELSLRHIVANPLAGPGVNLVVDLTGGYAFDQPVGAPPPLSVPRFAGNGVTHLDLSLALRITPSFTFLGIRHDAMIDLAPRLEWAIDSVARATRRWPSSSHRTWRPWLELAVGFGLPAPRRR